MGNGERVGRDSPYGPGDHHAACSLTERKRKVCAFHRGSREEKARKIAHWAPGLCAILNGRRTAAERREELAAAGRPWSESQRVSESQSQTPAPSCSDSSSWASPPGFPPTTLGPMIMVPPAIAPLGRSPVSPPSRHSFHHPSTISRQSSWVSPWVWTILRGGSVFTAHFLSWPLAF